MLSKTFDIEDISEASSVLGIEINRDRIRGLLGLSQRSYIDCVLNCFNMQDYRAGEVLITKGELPSKKNCPKIVIEQQHMENVSYASAVGSLMYVKFVLGPILLLQLVCWEDFLLILGLSIGCW